MTIPIRIWMCTILTTRKYNEAKENPSLFGLVKKLGAIHDKAESGGMTEEKKDSQVLLFLHRCMEERTMERSADVQDVSERAGNAHKTGNSQQSTSGNGASMGPAAAVREADAPISKPSNGTLKKRRQKKRKRMLLEEQLREEIERLSALYEANEAHKLTRHRIVAEREHLVDTTAAAATEEIFITRLSSPFPQFSLPFFLRSCLSEPFRSTIFHTPPPTMRSMSCPPRSTRSPHEMICPWMVDREMGGFGMQTQLISLHPSFTSLLTPMSGRVTRRTPRTRVPVEPDHEANKISTGEIIVSSSPASNSNQSRSPGKYLLSTHLTRSLSLTEATAIDDKTTCPQTEILTRSGCGFSRPAPTLSVPVRGSAPVFDPHVPDPAGESDDDPPNSGDSKATIQASTKPTHGKKSKKAKRKKPGKSSTRKRPDADKGLSSIQEQAVDDDETRQNDVETQDRAVTDAVPHRPSHPTHDTAKSSTSADIESCPVNALSSSVAKATLFAGPFSRQAMTEPELPAASSDFWAPVKPTTDPDQGESSRMAATRARAPNFFAVVPLRPVSRGTSTGTSSAKTPSSQAAVPAGGQHGDAFTSRITQATTAGPNTVVPAGSEETDFAQGAYPATMPGPVAAVPAGPSQGGVLATPTSVTDRSAQTSRAHAHDSTSEPRASESTENMGHNQPRHKWYDLTYNAFTCQLPGCTKRCQLWNSDNVFCRACGPYSESIYCCHEHMREDVKFHWVTCGDLIFDRPCVKSSVPFRSLVGPPQIRSVHDWSTPEHHRQALYFSTARQEGDYFIFADYAEQVSAGVPLGQDVNWRCSPRVHFTVKFTCEEEKNRFRRILAVCLMLSLEVQPLVCFLFRLIRDWFRARGQWNTWMDGMLRYQFRYEMAVWLTPDMTGERHACECEWTGRNLRHCRDPTCLSERPDFLADIQWGRGFQQLCDSLEANHWLLRAHRATHPTIKDVEARTRGQGFADVLPQDRRVFARGEGWDGFGTGPMELEESLTGLVYCFLPPQ